MSMKWHCNIVGVIVCSCNMIVDQCYCSQEVNPQFEKKNSWAVCWVFVAWNKFINICKWLQDFIIVLWMTCVEVMWNFSPSFEHRGAQRTNDGLSSHQRMSVIVILTVFMITVITPIITSINLVININIIIIIVIIVIPVIIIINTQGGVNISCFMTSFYAPKIPVFLSKVTSENTLNKHIFKCYQSLCLTFNKIEWYTYIITSLS